MSKETPDIIKLRIDLVGETKDMFLKIMKKYNLERYTETMRLIIKQYYEKEFKPSPDTLKSRENLMERLIELLAEKTEGRTIKKEELIQYIEKL